MYSLQFPDIINKFAKRVLEQIRQMQKDCGIFLRNEQEGDNGTPEQIRYIHDTQSDDFISQFLWDQGSHELSREKPESAPVMQQGIGQIVEEKLQKLKQKRQKSLFHNFQKHLVITLKKIVRIKAEPVDGLVGKIAEQMWQIFLKSHLFTKTILHILYGATQRQEEECSFTSAMLNRFGYVDLVNRYSEDLFKQAQQYLRKQTVKAVKKVNLKQYLSKRRLSKVQQFQDYLSEFLGELSQGPIKRRIPKKNKKQIKSYKKASEKKEPNESCRQRDQVQENQNI